jgi:Immunoglobulin domain
MPKPYIPVNECIDIAKVSQYLAADNRAMQLAFSGGFVNKNIPSLIRVVREALEWGYTNNSSDISLIAVSNYLYSICEDANRAQVILGINAQAGTAPVFTLQPSNINQQAGTSASLTVDTTGTPIIYYQWQKYNGTVYVNIIGATTQAISFSSLSVLDEGNYRCVASNAYGTTISSVATISVAVQLQCFYAYSIGDPYAAIQGGTDPLTYQVSQVFNSGASSISLNLLAAGQNNQFGTFKIPIGQPLKTAWYNTAFDNGQIPDSVWRDPITLNGYDYYITRIEFTYTSTSPLIFS